MRTTTSLLHPFRHMICWIAVVACLLAFQARASAGPSDVTAVVNNGTLEVKRAAGTTGEGFFRVGIRLEEGPNDGISVFVDDVLLDTFSKTGISAIDVDADQSLVTLGQSTLFEFEGDIAVDVRTGGLCSLWSLHMTGNLFLTGSSGSIRVEYRGAFVDGDVTVIGGPGDDSVSRDFGGGNLFVYDGNLHIDGGPGKEFVQLDGAFVTKDTLIDLGQSSSGGNDADYCELSFSQFYGSVMIAGDEGDDWIALRSTAMGSDLLVELGNGADFLTIRSLQLLAEEPLFFLDGGNGNSDTLSVQFFDISPDEYTGFETVIP